MKRAGRALLALAGIVVAGGIWACVGEDPILPGASPNPDGGASVEAGASDGSAPTADSGPDAGSAGSDAGLDAASARIFVTKNKYNGGEFGGTTGADTTCAAIASAKGFAGVYRAWLSTETTDAISRIQGNGPWRRLNDDEVVFKDRGALGGVPLVPVLFDEEGTSVANNSNAWTGTSIGGTRSSSTCSNWASSDGALEGGYGLADKSDSTWTAAGGEPCNDFVRLLCLRAD